MRTTSLIPTAAVPILLALTACAEDSRAQLVTNIDEFKEATKTLQPGDRIVLASGIWNDVELRLSGEGRADSPIELTAEEPGKVIITGQSNLRFSGSHIHVSGLVFTDGFTPTSEVISFRTSKDDLANHSV